jgi:hypothetical protein
LTQKPVCLSARAGSNQRQEADRADFTSRGFFTMLLCMAFLSFRKRPKKSFAVPWGLGVDAMELEPTHCCCFYFLLATTTAAGMPYARFVDLRCRRIGPGSVDGYCWFFTYGQEIMGRIDTWCGRDALQDLKGWFGILNYNTFSRSTWRAGCLTNSHIGLPTVGTSRSP